MFGFMLAESVGERLAEALLPEPVRLFGDLSVNPSYFTAVGVTLFLILVAALIRIFFIPKFKEVPSAFQLFLESIVNFFDKLAHDTAHDTANFVGPYIFTAAVYICIGTLVELFGIRPAFADINTCISMGFMTFVIINFFGAKKKKWRRATRYLNPINIMTDLAVPVSLSIRLFGSIVSGLLIMELVYSYIAMSFAIPAVLSVITTLFHALIQAYIFATLTSLFVGEAIE